MRYYLALACVLVPSVASADWTSVYGTSGTQLSQDVPAGFSPNFGFKDGRYYFVAQSIVLPESLYGVPSGAMIASAFAAKPAVFPFTLWITGARTDPGLGLGLAPNFADRRGRVHHDSDSLGTWTRSAGATVVVPGETVFVVLEGWSLRDSPERWIEPNGWYSSGNLVASASGTDVYPAGEALMIDVASINSLTDLDALPWRHGYPHSVDLLATASVDYVPVPEPSTLGLILSLAGTIALFSRRRHRLCANYVRL